MPVLISICVIATLIWSLYQPFNAAIAFVVFLFLFDGWLLLKTKPTKFRAMDGAKWAEDELTAIGKYYVYFYVPEMARSLSLACSITQISAVVWVPWLLYNRLWIPALIVLANYLVAGKLSVRLNPRHFLHDAVERRKQSRFIPEMVTVDLISGLFTEYGIASPKACAPFAPWRQNDRAIRRKERATALLRRYRESSPTKIRQRLADEHAVLEVARGQEADKVAREAMQRLREESEDYQRLLGNNPSEEVGLVGPHKAYWRIQPKDRIAGIAEVLWLCIGGIVIKSLKQRLRAIQSTMQKEGLTHLHPVTPGRIGPIRKLLILAFGLILGFDTLIRATVFVGAEREATRIAAQLIREKRLAPEERDDFVMSNVGWCVGPAFLRKLSNYIRFFQ